MFAVGPQEGKSCGGGRLAKRGRREKKKIFFRSLKACLALSLEQKYCGGFTGIPALHFPRDRSHACLCCLFLRCIVNLELLLQLALRGREPAANSVVSRLTPPFPFLRKCVR